MEERRHQIKLARSKLKLKKKKKERNKAHNKMEKSSSMLRVFRQL